ncbi:hypothetical protein Leryth_027028, partial [Lithospermum erythrorhizon]
SKKPSLATGPGDVIIIGIGSCVNRPQDEGTSKMFDESSNIILLRLAQSSLLSPQSSSVFSELNEEDIHPTTSIAQKQHL